MFQGIKGYCLKKFNNNKKKKKKYKENDSPFNVQY